MWKPLLFALRQTIAIASRLNRDASVETRDTGTGTVAIDERSLRHRVAIIVDLATKAEPFVPLMCVT